jgi:hypothetical protein
MRKATGLLSMLSTIALGVAACSDTSGLTQRQDAGADTKTAGNVGTGGSISGGGGTKGSGGAVGGAQAGGGNSGAGGVASGGGAKSSGGSTGAGGAANRDGGVFTMPDLGFQLPDGGFKLPDLGFQLPDGGFQLPDGGFTMPDLGFRFPDGGFTMPDLPGFNLDALPGVLGDAGISIPTCESSAASGADCKAGTDTACTTQSGGFCLCFGATWTCL